MGFNVVILSIFLMLAETRGEVRLSYRVAQSVCKSAVKFARSNQIDSRPSQSSFVSSDDVPCKTLTWYKKCESNTQSACVKFKSQECSPPSGQVQTKPKKGRRKNKGMVRVVNGTMALPNEFPYMIRLSDHDGDFTFCGGIIFNENYVVTAAHCVYLLPSDEAIPYYVMAGDYDQSKKDGTEQQRNVTREIFHELYNITTQEHDIVLLQVHKPFEFSDVVFPPNFPDQNYDATGQIGVAAGWGSIALGANGSEVLLKVSLPIISYDDCKKMYLNAIPGFPFRDVAVCTEFQEGGKDVCSGDTGGPLVVKIKNDCDLFVGITSTGEDCADPKFPSIYTHVANHIDWIKQNAV